MELLSQVDKHIRRLDADLARFEADLKDKMEGSDFESSAGRGLKKGRGQKEKRGSRGRGRRTSEEDTPKKKKHKGGSEFADTILSVHPSDVLDMPVDPNEPTYCLCHQVSYGEMIGCDNPDCPIEWFHFACVDLTTKPKGKWSVWLRRLLGCPVPLAPAVLSLFPGEAQLAQGPVCLLCLCFVAYMRTALLALSEADGGLRASCSPGRF